MPTDTFGVSNPNYKFLMKIADIRQVSLSMALNGILDDARFRVGDPKLKAERQVQSGDQAELR